jgi:rhamnulokinase
MKGYRAMTARTMAAIDLGAESGRVMLARYDGQSLLLEEVHRFPNRPVKARGHRFWDVLRLWDDTFTGLRKARAVTGQLDSIGVDTWGVDYGLVNTQGFLRSQPFHYRDHRTDGALEELLTRVPREMIYERTGIQFMPINTLIQLYVHERDLPGELSSAYRLLLIPDLLNSWLSGEMLSEGTNASTTQCWDPISASWATDLLDLIGLPSAMLPPVIEPGTAFGTVLGDLRDDLGSARVIAPATHDTGSAVVATPVPEGAGNDWAYISSGTWSLVGIETPQPIMTREALAGNWTNEGGVFGTTRFLKNVMGLWLLQECRRAWAHDRGMQGIADYDTLLSGIESVPAHAALIDPDDPRFLAPAHMPDEINAYLREHEQTPLQSPEAFARCILESLVLRYCEVLRQLEQITSKKMQGIHILGGGSRNTRLNQWLADAFGVPVIAGPTEATALGNALMQLVGLGDVRTLSEVRAIARQTPTQLSTPRHGEQAKWIEAAARYGALSTKRAS